MKTTDYPLFIPPTHLAQKGRTNWNAAEAEEYRDWLLSVMNDRIEAMLVFWNVPSSDQPSEHLRSLGNAVAGSLLGDPLLSEDGPAGPKLSNRGYALAADMGLLLAKYLLAACPEIHWEIIRKPKEMSYNLPVLRGFTATYIEPVGGSIAEATGILRRKRTGGAWEKAYNFWREKV